MAVLRAGGVKPVRTRRTSGSQLSEVDLRALVKGAAVQQAAADSLHRRLADHDRSLAAFARREEELHDGIGYARTRLTDATRTLDEHDRTLRRRGHRIEIARAKTEVRSLPGHIEDLERELAELLTTIEAERAARDRAVERAADPHGHGDTERVRELLDEDSRIRGQRAAGRPTPVLITHFGAVPDERIARERWVAAAGRIAQHRALWDLPEGTLAGPRPPLGEPEYAITYYAANQAIADLGRSYATDAPGHGPGIGLSL